MSDSIPTRFEFQAIGTLWQIDIKDNLSISSEVLLDLIKNRISIFDLNYSRFRNDSLVSKMSEESGEYILPEDADKMIVHYEKVYKITNGLVTPLIGQVLVDAGYDANYSLKESALHKPPSWDEVMEWQKPTLIMKYPALLDFGAGGKGYLVDIVSELLEENGINSYSVDAGGDMRYRDASGKQLKVGLENPNDISEVVGVVEILNKSICGSAGNRRKWGNFHHIINPDTLTSPEEIIAVWVIAENTLLADLMTTAIFFAKPELLLKHFDFEYFIVFSDFSTSSSNGFKAELFS